MIMTKFSMISLSVVTAFSMSMSGCSDSSSTSQGSLQPVNDVAKASALVAKMTPEEKLSLLSGPGFSRQTSAALKPEHLEGDVVGIAGYINGVNNSQVNIPPVKLADGPAGVRLSPIREHDPKRYYATAWPIGSLLASSWDPQLVQRVGQAFGQEAKELGIDFLLAPGMDIQRNPLNGRNFEYYSEDPLLSGKMSAAMVEGIQSNGVGATIKHFVANNSETNRHNIDEIMTPRSLREIYLRGFHIAIENAQPWALMTSYNKINGVYTNARKDLLTTIARQEWGFKGLIMSDWFAGDLDHVEQQVQAGNDLIEPGGDDVYNHLLQAYQNGTLSPQVLDQSATHIVTQVIKTPTYHHYPYAGVAQHKPWHAQLSREAATESMVLLKNSGATLPIHPEQSIASFGIAQVNTYKGGTGSGDVHAPHIINIAEGLAHQFTVNRELQQFYTQYFNVHKQEAPGALGTIGNEMLYTCDEPSIGSAMLQTYARQNDIAVITIGRLAGEGRDRSPGKGDYLLSDNEQTLIKQVSQAFHQQHKKVVVVLNIPGVIDTEWSNQVDSILLAYMPGQEAGDAVADILSGRVSPSGKLAQTFPLHYRDVPSSQTFPGVDTDDDQLPDVEYYNEGIYVGYRYYDTFHKPVAYPFGFGLSYTSFTYQNRSLVQNTINSLGARGHIQLSVDVRNSGKRIGKEVAEVYIAAPQRVLDKPAIELKAFAKTKWLKSGVQQRLLLDIPAEILASFDVNHNQWIIEPGVYKAYIAASSDVSDIIPVQFNINHLVIVRQTTPEVLALPQGISQSSFVNIHQ
ncbi:glycoside hydrolase family 3 C-terminal domain-containing protein [Celerinatantimonas sp. YJH-8]|uniref:glycoside hydrolase family 3 C-terminal domain-containing protein n=1 Tax=Celerinatantimonas sp. YJH-8 TaxID=3228714 RepID=UPI0038CB6102